jgi:hypothetical protein
MQIDTESMAPDVEIGSTGSTADLQQRRSKIIDYFRGYIHETFDELHVAGAQQTQELEKGLHHIELEEESIRGWEDFMHGEAERMRQSGRILHEKTKAMLGQAMANKLISSESKDRWMKRLYDPSVNFKSKEYFVENQLPHYIESWEKVKKEHASLLKNQALKNLTKDDVPELSVFMNEKDFRAMHYEKKMHLVSAVSSAIRAKERHQDALYKRAKGTLDAAASAGVMSANKVGVWLKRLFGHEYTTREIEQYMGTTLDQYIKNWTKVRYRFDRVERQIETVGMPQGMQRFSAEKFLSWEYAQRLSYVEEAERRLNVQDTPATGEIGELKLQIRHALDTEDWEDAKYLIAKARSIAQGEDIYELDSMERYLNSFRTPEEESGGESAEETLEEMRAALEQVPSSLRPIYENALTEGYGVTKRLMTMVYNRVWCWEHGWLSAHKEVIFREQAAEDTKRALEDGLSPRGLANIDLDDVSTGDQKPVIPDYNGRWAPTMIHYRSNGKGALLEKIRSGNYASAYWTTLIPKDVSYEKQRYLVKNVNWRFKSGMRKLQAAGLAFTPHGPPISRN